MFDNELWECGLLAGDNLVHLFTCKNWPEGLSTIRDHLRLLRLTGEVRIGYIRQVAPYQKPLVQIALRGARHVDVTIPE